ncbi:MAG: ABC transporter ATP-binding protein [Pseudomonadota bacterium]
MHEKQATELAEQVLEVDGLSVCFEGRHASLHAVNGIDFTLRRGETLALVGESGCGKSVTANAILRLLPSRRTRIEGRIRFLGADLLRESEARMQAIRGNEIAMIFQEPMTALNPLLTIGLQVAEPLMRHRRMSRQRAFGQAVELLERVHVPDPGSWLDRYPHEMSGGMRQRAMIAMALACEPKLLIADEPTTALDVTIQAQILQLIAEIQRDLGVAVLLITHDFGVVAEAADRAVVLYAGTVVERAAVAELFRAPRHPYTRGLLAALPTLEVGEAQGDLAEIPGVVPSLAETPTDCPFAPRCGFADSDCFGRRPPIASIAPDHEVACWHVDRVIEGVHVGA